MENILSSVTRGIICDRPVKATCIKTVISDCDFFLFCLFSKSDDVAALKDEHSTTVRQLEEQHTDSVSKMTDIVTELER